MSTKKLLCMALVVAGTAAGVAGSSDPPVVVAIDTSRSLSPADIKAVGVLVPELVWAKGATVPMGLVSFDDEVRWVLEPHGCLQELAEALSRLTPRGSYTMLHDALFIIARELEQGGVILLATDGRDENSATVLEDVARQCTQSDVRIVVLALGRRVDERALRRLALLTDGTYVGRAGQVTAGQVGQALAQARQAVAASVATRAAAGQEPLPSGDGQSAADAAVRQVQPSPSDTMPWSWQPLLVVCAALAAAAVVVWLMLRRDRRPTIIHGEPRLVEREDESSGIEQSRIDLDQEGSEAEYIYDELSPAATQGIRLVASQQPVASTAIPDESLLGPDVFKRRPLPDGLEQTLVLDEQPVLIVREPGKPPRSYTLPRDSTFAVGRAPRVNTLQVSDPAVSSQHFKVVPKNGEYYVVDLDTTNGTTVNSQKVKARKLAPGDVIIAGMVEVEYNLSIRRVS